MAKDKKAADAEARDKYNRGDFQTTDPVTGEARGAMGGTWQTAEDIEAAADADTAAAAPAAKPAPRKRGRAAKKVVSPEPDFG